MTPPFCKRGSRLDFLGLAMSLNTTTTLNPNQNTRLGPLNPTAIMFVFSFPFPSRTSALGSSLALERNSNIS